MRAQGIRVALQRREPRPNELTELSRTHGARHERDQVAPTSRSWKRVKPGGGGVAPKRASSPALRLARGGRNASRGLPEAISTRNARIASSEANSKLSGRKERWHREEGSGPSANSVRAPFEVRAATTALLRDRGLRPERSRERGKRS